MRAVLFEGTPEEFARVEAAFRAGGDPALHISAIVLPQSRPKAWPHHNAVRAASLPASGARAEPFPPSGRLAEPWLKKPCSAPGPDRPRKQPRALAHALSSGFRPT
jgi:hypothetical protein